MTEKKLDFVNFRQFSDIFVETGTGRLHGIWAAIKAGFKNILSVEASLDYFVKNYHDLEQSGFIPNGKWSAAAKTRIVFTKDDITIQLFWGMSQEYLCYMLHDFRKPVVLWLDAHVSGPLSAGHEDYEAKGEESLYSQHKVLQSEIKTIFEHRLDHVLLIDDQNGPNKHNEEYQKFILSKNPTYQFEFLNEDCNGVIYNEKCLVCIPNPPI